MTEFWILIILGIAGILMHQIKKAMEHDPKQYPARFTIDQITAYDKKQKRDKLYSTIFNIIAVVILVYVREDVAEVYPVTKLSIVITGWWADSIFLGLMKTRKPNIGGSKI